jgi:hypothetical protein
MTTKLPDGRCRATQRDALTTWRASEPSVAPRETRPRGWVSIDPLRHSGRRVLERGDRSILLLHRGRRVRERRHRSILCATVGDASKSVGISRSFRWETRLTVGDASKSVGISRSFCVAVGDASDGVGIRRSTCATVGGLTGRLHRDSRVVQRLSKEHMFHWLAENGHVRSASLKRLSWMTLVLLAA